MLMQGQFRSFLGGRAFFFMTDDEEAPTSGVFLNG
jgi:hypothetical protein